MRRRSPTPDVAETVLARACAGGGYPCCELCGGPITGLRGFHYSLHHRRGRDGKPDSHWPQNLLLVHGGDNVTGCHGRIHRNREGESVVNGWLLSRNARPTPNPLLVPVLLHGESVWKYLDAFGEYSDNPPVEAA